MDGRQGFPRWRLEGIYESNVCPRRVVTDDSARWLSLYPHYEKGHLLMRGALSDQPAIFIDAMALIASTIDKARAEQRSG